MNFILPLKSTVRIVKLYRDHTVLFDSSVPDHTRLFN